MTTETLWAPVAGRYGRTRDGRKVGPMICSGDNCYAGEAHWYSNGRYYSACESQSDLVSEWIDEPTPQPIDFSKIKVGDRVRLGGEFEVDRVSSCSVGIMVQGSCIYLGSDDLGGAGGRGAVVAHIPALRSIEVGCRVRVAGYAHNFISGEVKAIDGGDAWVLWGSGIRNTWPTDDLTLVDDKAT